jgi:hypothetical protein
MQQFKLDSYVPKLHSGGQGISGTLTVLKLWSNTPHEPSPNCTKPHLVRRISRCKQRNGETYSELTADLKSSSLGMPYFNVDPRHDELGEDC